MNACFFILFMILTNISAVAQIEISTSVDLDNDGVNEQILFYHFDSDEFENSFTKFKIITKNDTTTFDSINGWASNGELYSKYADINVANNLGVFRIKSKIFLWLSGPDIGCCYRDITIFQFYPVVMKLMDQEFDVINIENIGKGKYISGRKFLSQYYSCSAQNLNFRLFNPVFYYNITDGFILDDSLTIKKNSIYRTIEPKVDIFHASILYDLNTKEEILINKDFERKICERKYAVASLFKLTEKYLIYFSGDELKKMRNEIFAVYGYKFKSQDLIDYFSDQEWYKPKEITLEEINNKLTDIEKYNVALIKKIEEK